MFNYVGFKIEKYFMFAPFSTEFSKVLVALGYPTTSPAMSTEVLDLTNNNIACQNLGPFSKGRSGSTGGLVGGKPLILSLIHI